MANLGPHCHCDIIPYHPATLQRFNWSIGQPPRFTNIKHKYSLGNPNSTTSTSNGLKRGGV